VAVSDAVGLLFHARGDTSQAREEFSKLRKQIVNETDAIKGAGGNAFVSLAKDIGLTESQITKFAGALPIAGAAIAGIAGSAVAAITGLFSLAKSAAEYGSEIHDAAQQTGISTDSIQALKYAAEESGSSLEAITATVAKFSALLGDAKNGNDKAIATLKQYGVTATDTDTALAQAIKTIADMTDHDKQAAAAKALFRERTAEILPVIESFSGDLPALIQRLREMGILMSKDGTDAADQFGDKLDDLQKQLRAVGVSIGSDLIPVFTDLFTKLSGWLAQNKNETAEWSKAVSSAVGSVVLDIRKETNDLKALGAVLEWVLGIVSNNDQKIDAAEQKLRDAHDESVRIGRMEAGEDPDRKIRSLPPSLGSNFNSPFTGPGQDVPFPGALGATPSGFGIGDKEREQAEKDAEKRRKEREAAFQKELSERSKQQQLLLRQARDEFTQLNEQWEKGFLAGEKTKEQFREVALNNITAYGQRAQALLDKQLKIDLQGKTGTARENVTLEFQSASTALYNELQKEREDLDKTIDNQAKKSSDDQIKLKEKTNAELTALEHSRLETETALLKRELDDRFITEVQYAQRIGIAKQRQLELERDRETDPNRRKILDEQIAQQEIENVNLITEAWKKEGEQIVKNNEALNDRKQQIEDASHIAQDAITSTSGLLDEVVNSGLGGFDKESGGGGIFDSWTQSWKNFYESIMADGPTLTQMIQGIGSIMVDAYSGVAQAIGGVTQQWVLYGKTGPAIMRQILAQALASIAAEAAVKAIFQLAEGFASLFFNPAEAAAHFTAAALYGSIAVGAAVAGRAVAGNAFKTQSDRAAGTSAGGAAAGRAAGGGGSQNGGQIFSKYGDDPSVLNIGRNVPEEPVKHMVTIKLELDKNGVLNVFHQDVRRNGPTRGLIVDVANGG
jgi:hypothetical protein